MSNLPTLKKYTESDEVKNRMAAILDNNAPAFISSIITSVSNNKSLQECKPASIMSAAFVAAALKLPIDPNLGFSAIVPYKDSAQFQIMAKGFVQLAIRSGQYKNIHVAEVYADELEVYNPVTGLVAFTDVNTWSQRYSGKNEPVGYYARFELVTGFVKEDYKSRKEIEAHAKKYSKAYGYDLRKGKKSSVWSTDFDAMARKTILKLLLSKYGILSTELQEAVLSDQKTDQGYTDNPQKKENVIEADTNPVADLLGGLSNEKEKLSVSGLKEFSKSLQHYLDYKARKKEQTDPMRFGCALHTAVLEPERFDKEVNVLDVEIDRRTKLGKMLAKELENTIYVTPKELNIIKAMHKAIFTHPIASHLISKSKQKEIWLNGKLDTSHGSIDVHGKADCVNQGKRNICIDLKTIGDADIDSIESSVKKYNYHWQAYFYKEMLRQEHGEDFEVYFIFVDKTPAHNVQVIALDDYWYEVAEEEIEPLLNDFYKYLAEGPEKLYRGYSNTIKTIKCPGWLKNRSKNSRFHEALNSLDEPLIEFLGGKKNDSNDKPAVSDNAVKDADIKASPKPRENVVTGDVYEPKDNKEVLDTIVEKVETVPDDVDLLLDQAGKLTGYQTPDAALQCTIDKVCGPGVKADDLEFKQKQKVLTEIDKMRNRQASAKVEKKRKEIKPKAPVTPIEPAPAEAIDDELDF